MPQAGLPGPPDSAGEVPLFVRDEESSCVKDQRTLYGSQTGPTTWICGKTYDSILPLDCSEARKEASHWTGYGSAKRTGIKTKHNLNAQAVRRMRDQHFPRYHLDNQKECEEFVGALQSLLECVPMTVDVPALLTRWRWFGEWSMGCVGVLGDWIVETVDALWSAGETVLTVEALTRHALQPDQRARLEMEARTGEYRVARAKAQSERELQQLLGTPAPDGKPSQANLDSPSTDVSGRERNGGRIERAAQRDPVGDQIPTTNTGKCSFSGVMEILAQQFLESGVERVECPDCHALRQITPRNGILRYPTHDKRKTRAPQTEPRWAQGETGWEVTSGAREVTPRAEM